MAPAPTSSELIASARADAAGEDVLAELAAAAALVADLEAAADATLEFFVDQCRRVGRTWSEISGALCVTKQAAHKRFTVPGPSAELFTPRAQSALRAAVEEARMLGHNYVGTEHLLLGLFEPAGGIAAKVLVEAGVSRAQVAQEVANRVPGGPRTARSSAPPPYTPRATRCKERARSEALSMGHNFIGTEHLLLALLDDGDGLAAQLLGTFGLQRTKVRASIVEKLSGFTSRDE
ncbi:MAG: Clp protease N-terminal domain-containing protein [Acidimicrobiia bacterium]